jgi:uncharacterized membrane protein YkvI
MKVAGAVIVLLAILIAVVPMFTDCESAGRSLTLENGRQIPMKCHWTARAELGLGLPLLGVGLMMVPSRRKETRRTLGIMGSTLGVLAILLPTVLIGVCGNPDMPCLGIMQPALLLMGSLVIGVSVVVVAMSWGKDELAA